MSHLEEVGDGAEEDAERGDQQSQGGPEDPLVQPSEERENQDEGNLRDLVTGEYPGRLLGLDPELLLDGCEDRGEVGVGHTLDRPQERVEHHVHLRSTECQGVRVRHSSTVLPLSEQTSGAKLESNPVTHRVSSLSSLPWCVVWSGVVCSH